MDTKELLPDSRLIVDVKDLTAILNATPEDIRTRIKVHADFYCSNIDVHEQLEETIRNYYGITRF